MQFTKIQEYETSTIDSRMYDSDPYPYTERPHVEVPSFLPFQYVNKYPWSTVQILKPRYPIQN